MCKERRAAPQYYRVNEVTEQVEHLCRACWIALRRSERDDWQYFKGATRLVLLYTVLPVVVAVIVAWLLISWIL
jgi:hypothetical protein